MGFACIIIAYIFVLIPFKVIATVVVIVVVIVIQSNFNSSNNFGTMKICSRQG